MPDYTKDTARKAVEDAGMSFEHDKDVGEYVVDFPRGHPAHVGGDEGTSYRTDDLSDAVGTAQEMSAHHERNASPSDRLRAATEQSSQRSASVQGSAETETLHR